MIVSTLLRRSLAVSAFVCLVFPFLSAQVHIREKVEIKPLQAVRMQSVPSTTHRLRVDVQWDQPWFGRFDTYTPCGLRSDTGTSHIGFTIDPAPGGTYPHFSLFLNRPAGQTAHVIFELYLDDQLVIRDSTLYGQFSSGWPDASFNTPYFDGFHFSLPPDPVFYEEGTMEEVTGFNQCGSTTSWNPSTDIVTLTIVSGSEYVQFWNVADYPRVPMGSSISVLASQLQDYMLAADGTLPDSQGVWVNVSAESNGLEEMDSVLVVPYYLRFVFDPDSVQAGEESRIVIKTVDAQGDDHFRLIEPLVSVGIKDSTEYGTLSYNEFGEVLADTIDGIQTLLIADEFSGVELKFLANEKVPTQTFPVTLFAKKTDEGLSFFPIPPSLYPFPGRDTVKGEGRLRLVAVPDSLDHFEVIVQPDTIKHGDTSTVRIQAKDVNNINVDPPPNTLVDVSLNVFQDLGRLAYASQSGLSIQNVPYVDASGGLVKFIANGRNPIGEGPQAVSIGVTNGQKEGTGQVVLECKISVPRYPQGGSGPERPTWADSIYDATSINIATLGCALSCMAMTMTAFGDTVNPGELNAWMKMRNGKTGGFADDRVDWHAISLHSPQDSLEQVKTPKDLFKNKESKLLDSTQITPSSILDDYLGRCELVIVQVFNDRSAGTGQHWVVVTGKNQGRYTIVDPGNRDEKFLDQYGSFWAYVVVSKKKS